MTFPNRNHLFLVLPLSSEHIAFLKTLPKEYCALFLNNPLYLSLIKKGSYFFLAKELSHLCRIDNIINKYTPHVLSLLKRLLGSVNPESLLIIAFESASYETLDETYFEDF